MVESLSGSTPETEPQVEWAYDRTIPLFIHAHNYGLSDSWKPFRNILLHVDNFSFDSIQNAHSRDVVWIVNEKLQTSPINLKLEIIKNQVDAIDHRRKYLFSFSQARGQINCNDSAQWPKILDPPSL